VLVTIKCMKKETYCAICGNKTKYGGKTCSRKCADELKKINNREKRICVYCKNTFTVKKIQQKNYVQMNVEKSGLQYQKIKTNELKKVKMLLEKTTMVNCL